MFIGNVYRKSEKSHVYYHKIRPQREVHWWKDLEIDNKKANTVGFTILEASQKKWL